MWAANNQPTDDLSSTGMTKGNDQEMIPFRPKTELVQQTETWITQNSSGPETAYQSAKPQVPN